MKYLCLIYSEPAAGPQTEEAQAAEMPQWFEYTAQVEAAGVMAGGEALLPPETATMVAMRDGVATHTDGPFAETKEHLGGYYLLDCADLDEALGWAAKIPAATYGRIEVRPVMELPDA